MHDMEQNILEMVEALPGKAAACRGCGNATNALGCKIDVQSKFYLRSHGEDRTKFIAEIQQKMAKMPPGCPIKELIEKRNTQSVG